MARVTTFILLLLSISLVACGPYEIDDPQSELTAEDMAYLTPEEKAWLEEARAQRASLSTSPAPALTKTSTTMNKPEVNQPTSSTDLVWHPVHDPKLGMTCEYIPLPADWTVSSQGWDGPGGTMVRMEQGQRYFLEQTPYRSIDQLLQQTIAPEIQKAGY